MDSASGAEVGGEVSTVGGRAPGVVASAGGAMDGAASAGGGTAPAGGSAVARPTHVRVTVGSRSSTGRDERAQAETATTSSMVHLHNLHTLVP